MRPKIGELPWQLLREIEWQGGVLVADCSAEDASYRQLASAGYIHIESAGDNRVRVELNQLGRHVLIAKKSEARKIADAVSSKLHPLISGD